MKKYAGGFIEENIRGIVIKDEGTDSYEVSLYPLNQTSKYSHSIQKLSNFSSPQAAKEAGVQCIKSHKFKFVECVGKLKISLRLSWHGHWSYCVSGTVEKDFQTRPLALAEARIYAKAKNKELFN